MQKRWKSMVGQKSTGPPGETTFVEAAMTDNAAQGRERHWAKIVLIWLVLVLLLIAIGMLTMMAVVYFMPTKENVEEKLPPFTTTTSNTSSTSMFSTMSTTSTTSTSATSTISSKSTTSTPSTTTTTVTMATTTMKKRNMPLIEANYLMFKEECIDEKKWIWKISINYTRAECQMANILFRHLDFNVDPNEDFNKFVCPGYYNRRAKRSIPAAPTVLTVAQKEMQAKFTIDSITSTINGFCEQKLTKGYLLLMPVHSVIGKLRRDFGMFPPNGKPQFWTEFNAAFWRAIGTASREFNVNPFLYVSIGEKINVHTNRPTIALWPRLFPDLYYSIALPLLKEIINWDLPFEEKVHLRADIEKAFSVVKEAKLGQFLNGSPTVEEDYWTLNELNSQLKTINLEALFEGMKIENLPSNFELYVPDIGHLLRLDRLLARLNEPQAVMDLVGARILLEIYMDARRNVSECFASFQIKHMHNHLFMKDLNVTKALKELEAVKKFGKSLFDQAELLIGQSTSIGEGFREKAMEKIKSMRSIYGWPSWYNVSTSTSLIAFYGDYVEAFSKIRVRPTDPTYYFQVLMARNAMLHRRSLLELQKSPEQIEKAMIGSSRIEAYGSYFVRSNLVYITSQAVNYSNFNPDFDSAFNYGSLGFTIGHEIGHAFSLKNIQIAPNGTDYADLKWIDRKLAQTMKELNICLLRQYASKCSVGDQNVNAFGTLNENFADFFGIRLAYNAYLTHKNASTNSSKFHALPGIENLTQNQLFWISYAIKFCSNAKEDAKLLDEKEDEHAPNICRINTLLGNVPEFARDFGCEPGDGMCPEEGEEKCQMWI